MTAVDKSSMKAFVPFRVKAELVGLSAQKHDEAVSGLIRPNFDDTSEGHNNLILFYGLE